MDPRLAPLARLVGGTVSRRAMLRRLGAASLLTASGASLAAAAVEQVAAHRDATPTADGAAEHRELVLTAEEFDWPLMADTVVRAWGYNGQVPGPEIRVREGDHVRVTLRNRLPVPTTIHWHGVNVPAAMDGPAGLNQAPVPPGEEFVYEFTARPAGSRWYHSHADPAVQLPLGLYGPLVVEPRRPARAYDREYTYVLAEWDLQLTPDVATGEAPPGPGDRMMRGGELGADFFLMNGRTHGAISPIRLATGDRVLIRLMNAGNMPHAFHTHGHSFKIVATDGNPVPEAAQLTKDTVLIGPGERYDLEFVGDNPGVWMVHCHMENHMANGMMTLIVYDGYEATGPVAAFLQGAATPAAGHQHPAATMPAAPMAMGTETAAAAPVPAMPPAAATAPAAGPTGKTVEIAMVDDRFVPPVTTVPAGTTVTWVNHGRDWHSVAAYDGSFQSGRIAPGQSYAVRLTKPGDYPYLCKHHGLQGMIGRITVAAPT